MSKFVASVIIPTQGDLTKINRILTSLKNQKNFVDFEIIVVVNPVLPLVNEIRGRYSDLNLIILQLPEIGVNRARMAGFTRASASIVFFFDDDCALNDSETLMKCVQSHHQQPELFALGGKYTFCSDSVDPQELRIQRLYFSMQDRWINEGVIDPHTGRCAYLLGGFCVVKKDLALLQGLEFDQAMKFGGTEKEFFLQAFKKNMQMHLISETVDHYYTESWFSYLKKIYKQGAGQKYIESKKQLFFESVYRLPEQTTDIFQSFIFESTYWFGYFSYDKNYLAFFRNRWQRFREIISLMHLKFVNRLKKDL